MGMFLMSPWAPWIWGYTSVPGRMEEVVKKFPRPSTWRVAMRSPVPPDWDQKNKVPFTAGVT
jgi:hypothetical protein